MNETRPDTRKNPPPRIQPRRSLGSEWTAETHPLRNLPDRLPTAGSDLDPALDPTEGHLLELMIWNRVHPRAARALSPRRPFKRSLVLPSLASPRRIVSRRMRRRPDL